MLVRPLLVEGDGHVVEGACLTLVDLCGALEEEVLTKLLELFKEGFFEEI